MSQIPIKYFNGISSKPSDALLEYSEGDFSVLTIIYYEEIPISVAKDSSSETEDDFSNEEKDLFSNEEDQINGECNIIHNEEDTISIKTHSITWNLKDIEWEKIQDKIEFRQLQPKGPYFKIQDAQFTQKFFTYLKHKKQFNLYNRLLEMSLQKFIGISVAFIGMIVLAYIYVLPYIAEKSVRLLPLSFDNSLGNIFYQSFINENNLDSTKTKWLDEFASELDFGEERELKFAVFDSPEVNAFALPNGQIVVYSGIIENMRSSNELAGLLGHEAAHVHHRHSSQMLSRNLAGYLLVSILLSDINGIMAIITENAHQLHSLSYSRRYEQEADESGLKILIDNHINPEGMVELFEHLNDEMDIELPQILSTHPLTKERKKNMVSLIEQSKFEANTHPKLDSLFLLLTEEEHY